MDLSHMCGSCCLSISKVHNHCTLCMCCVQLLAYACVRAHMFWYLCALVHIWWSGHHKLTTTKTFDKCFYIFLKSIDDCCNIRVKCKRIFELDIPVMLIWLKFVNEYFCGDIWKICMKKYVPFTYNTCFIWYNIILNG